MEGEEEEEGGGGRGEKDKTSLTSGLLKIVIVVSN